LLQCQKTKQFWVSSHEYFWACNIKTKHNWQKVQLRCLYHSSEVSGKVLGRHLFWNLNISRVSNSQKRFTLQFSFTSDHQQ
jgi:hypothetical protein